jgi:hypothetical protein
MDVQKLSMPKAEARTKLQYVRQQLHRRADEEYQQLETAYRAAAQGKSLIVLSTALRDAPRDEKGRPRIAIARADRVQVRFTAGINTMSFVSIGRGASFWDGRHTRAQGATISSPVASANNGIPNGYAIVPIVPPDVRGHHALETHFILWEVEAWADRQIDSRPDRDPFLLKHLGGELYAVVAEWDLTDIERAVMAGRARA